MDEELDKTLFSSLREDVTSLLPTLAPQDGDKLTALMTKLLALLNSGATGTLVMSTALEASKVLKNSAGRLQNLAVFNSKASAQFILIMDAAAVPVDGPVTLLYPPIPIGAGSIVVLDLPRPIVATVGVCVCNSSTGSFTKTIGSADCVFRGVVTA